MKVKCTRSRCLLEGCVKDNYYARFHLHSYHCCREMNFISRLDVNFPDSTQNIDKVTGAWNEGQGHRVKVPAWRVCQGQLLCKVSSSQLPLLQRNEVYTQPRRKLWTDGRTDGRTDERTESWTLYRTLLKAGAIKILALYALYCFNMYFADLWYRNKSINLALKVE